jgi:hypothetical protein
MAMPPQAMLRVRFCELAESMDVALSVRCQSGKFYARLGGAREEIRRFMQSAFPRAYMTSGYMTSEGEGEFVHRLPDQEVQRVLTEVQIEPAWLQWNDRAALRIAQHIRKESAYENLPILADALEEAGCDRATILSHCRAPLPHQETCWVVELLLGSQPKRRGSSRVA